MSLPIDRRLALAILLMSAGCDGPPGKTTGPVTSPVATRLGFLAQPNIASAGAMMSPAIVVAFQDGSGNTVTSATGAVTIGLATSPSGARLSGVTTVNAVNGVATFGNLSIDRAGTGYALSASSGTLTTARSTAFSVQGAKLTFLAQPNSGTAGIPISPAVIVAIQDATGTTDPNDSRTITLTRRDGGKLSGTTSVRVVGGLATFSDLRIDQASSAHILVASAGASASTQSLPFSIGAAAAARLGFLALPGDIDVAQPFEVRVAIQDAFQNTVPGATSSVTLTLTPNPEGATISGTLTLPATGGVAAFEHLALDRPGMNYTLTATSGTLAGTQSWSFLAWAAGALVSVSAGESHTCGVTHLGLGYCWGSNTNGQIGDGTTSDRASPVIVAPGMTMISAGAGHTCAITDTPRVYCWGLNSDGQLGDGTTVTRTSPVSVSGPFGQSLGQLSAGGSHTCGDTWAGSTSSYWQSSYCWGRNDDGEVGDGTTIARTDPRFIGKGLSLSSLTLGGSHTCGLSGDAYCWGANTNGQLGDGSTTSRPNPVRVAGGLTFVDLHAGTSHTCGRLGGMVNAYCWGLNDHGQLGDGTTTQATQPVPVRGGLTFTALASGGQHTCGLTGAGVAYCWGANGDGQLGDGTTIEQTSPVPVAGGLAFISISAGGSHTCGVVIVIGTYCWGANGFGQLGTGTTTASTVPVRVAGQQ